MEYLWRGTTRAFAGGEIANQNLTVKGRTDTVYEPGGAVFRFET